MLTSKQRAYLKSQASTIDTVLIVGKGGIGDQTIIQACDALKARELIKAKVLDNSPEEVLYAAKNIAEQTGAQVVQVIGNKFVLYKENKKSKKIILPRGKAV